MEIPSLGERRSPLSGAVRTPKVRFQGATQLSAGNVCFRGQSGRSDAPLKESACSQKET